MTGFIRHEERPDTALADEAVDWLVLLESGRATPADYRAFAAWQGRSPAHAAAARDASALWRGVGETATARSFAARNAHRRASRFGLTTRRAVLMGAGGAAVAAATGLPLLGPASGLLADYATRVGERRRVSLPDGSVAELNTATALSLHFADRVRRLELHAGEAMFEVAKEQARPFIVAAGGAEARALGTVFSVRRQKVVEVGVVEGEVEVHGAALNGAAVRVVAGQRVAVVDSGPLQGPEPFDVTAETAWRRGKLIFNRRPLGEVVSELERYRGGKIAITDARLRQLEVTGVFDLSDPDAVLRVIERTLPVTVVRLPFVALIY